VGLAGAVGLVFGKDDVGVPGTGCRRLPDGGKALPEDGGGSNAGTPIGW